MFKNKKDTKTKMEDMKLDLEEQQQLDLYTDTVDRIRLHKHLASQCETSTTSGEDPPEDSYPHLQDKCFVFYNKNKRYNNTKVFKTKKYNNKNVSKTKKKIQKRRWRI